MLTLLIMQMYSSSPSTLSTLYHSETSVPINVERVTIDTPLGPIVRRNVRYHNVLVPSLPNYIPDPVAVDTYVRSAPINRLQTEHVQWPDHPTMPNGKNTGAIVFIMSADDKVLLLRNGRMWGFPKGARNYKEFLRLKALTDQAFWNGCATPIHDSVSFSDVETPEENAIREIQEETGIIMDPARLTRWGEAPYTKFLYAFPHPAAMHRDILVANGTDHENDEMKWVTNAELMNMMEQHAQSDRVFNHITYRYLCELYPYD